MYTYQIIYLISSNVNSNPEGDNTYTEDAPSMVKNADVSWVDAV